MAVAQLLGLALVVGMPLLGMAITLPAWRTRNATEARGAHTVGTVTNARRDWHGLDTSTIRFEDVESRSYVLHDHHGRRVGDEVRLVYDPRDPRRVRLADTEYRDDVLSGVVLVAAWVFGLLLLTGTLAAV